MSIKCKFGLEEKKNSSSWREIHNRGADSDGTYTGQVPLHSADFPGEAGLASFEVVCGRQKGIKMWLGIVSQLTIFIMNALLGSALVRK